MIELELPFPPSANRLWRVGKGGKPYLSGDYEVWRKECLVACHPHKSAKINGPWMITIIAGRPDRRKRDLDNLIKPIVDAVVLFKLVDDDEFLEFVVARWVGEGSMIRVKLDECRRA